MTAVPLAALYDKEIMRRVAHGFGKTDAEFERMWAEFDASRHEVNRKTVALELALIARESR